MSEVRLRLALGTSNDQGGLFQLVVQNVATDKRASIWTELDGTWREIPATFVESLPGSRELWTAVASNREGEFVAKLEAGGRTFWDDANGKNYRFPRAEGELNVLTGRDHPLTLMDASFTSGGLRVYAAVQPGDDTEQGIREVGLIFTVNDWTTREEVLGHRISTLTSGVEIWQADAFVSPAHGVKLAVFCRTSGAELWDNNFQRDYSLGLLSEGSRMAAGAISEAIGRIVPPGGQGRSALSMESSS